MKSEGLRLVKNNGKTPLGVMAALPARQLENGAKTGPKRTMLKKGDTSRKWTRSLVKVNGIGDNGLFCMFLDINYVSAGA